MAVGDCAFSRAVFLFFTLPHFPDFEVDVYESTLFDTRYVYVIDNRRLCDQTIGRANIT